MDERDAANLLIGVNLGETARAAPEAVARYRALVAMHGNHDAEFGNELEKMLAAARDRRLQEYVAELVAKFGTPNNLASRQPRYELEIHFQKPRPSALIRMKIPDLAEGHVRFDQVDENEFVRPIGDRRETVAIGHDTITAVGIFLRG